MSINSTMSPDKLAVQGRALFGDLWQTALAKSLGVTDRTMRRWIAGDSPIPNGIEEEIQRLLKERSDKIAGLEEFSFEMTEEDFGKILQAMFDRGDKKWITPSGSITDVLRAYIKAGKIDNVSVACRMYFKVYGNSAGDFVARQLPAMLINHYKPITATLTFDQFLLWDRVNPEWQIPIVSHADSPNLSTKVRDIVASMSAFKKNA